MTTTTITVPGVPVAQPRQRHTKTGFNYTPTSHPSNTWKALIAMKWSEAVGQLRHTGPIRLELYLRLPRPKRLNAKKFGWVRVPHSARPDTDNLAKACMDALNRIAWEDDSLICQLYVEKCYAASGETPHAVIVVSDIQSTEVASDAVVMRSSDVQISVPRKTAGASLPAMRMPAAALPADGERDCGSMWQDPEDVDRKD